jgi:hypothetical protein
MKPAHSLPSSQEPATGPYPEAGESSSYTPTLCQWDPFQYFRPIYTLIFQVVFSLQSYLLTVSH